MGPEKENTLLSAQLYCITSQRAIVTLFPNKKDFILITFCLAVATAAEES